MTEYRLRRPQKGALNDVARSLVRAFGDELHKLSSFDLIEDKANLLGSGDATIVEIYIRYDAPSIDDLPDIDRIIEIASERADDIEVIVVNSEDTG